MSSCLTRTLTRSVRSIIGEPVGSNFFMFFFPCQCVFFSQRKAYLFSNSVCFLHHLSFGTKNNKTRYVTSSSSRAIFQCSVSCLKFQNIGQKIFKIKMLSARIEITRNRTYYAHYYVEERIVRSRTILFSLLTQLLVFEKKSSIGNIPNNSSRLDGCRFPRIT